MNLVQQKGPPRRQANRGNSVNNSIAEKNSGPALHPITYVP